MLIEVLILYHNFFFKFFLENYILKRFVGFFFSLYIEMITKRTPKVRYLIWLWLDKCVSAPNYQILFLAYWVWTFKVKSICITILD